MMTLIVSVTYIRVNIVSNPVVLIYILLLASNCYFNQRPKFWPPCFNSSESKAQVRY